MNKIIGVATALVVALATGAAHSQGSPDPAKKGALPGGPDSGSATSVQTVTGIVRTFDSKSRSLTLQDGTQFQLSEAGLPSSVREGDRVRVRYHMQGDRRIAMDVAGATDSPAGSSNPTVGTTGSGGTIGAGRTAPTGSSGQ